MLGLLSCSDLSEPYHPPAQSGPWAPPGQNAAGAEGSTAGAGAGSSAGEHPTTGDAGRSEDLAQGGSGSSTGGAGSGAPSDDVAAGSPGDGTLSAGGAGGSQSVGAPRTLATASTPNLFVQLLEASEQEVEAKVRTAVERVFGIGTGEGNELIEATGYRLYFELPQDPQQAFIWAPDSNDIRSEGMSYGMMIAVQRDMQSHFDKLWSFAQTYMQYPADAPISPWRHYFRWQGWVNPMSSSLWSVNYLAATGPAPDGEEYFAAALYLAHRRWGSTGEVDYKQHADDLTHAMLHNAEGDARTPVFDANANMVVFYPHGDAAEFSDPSYHLPAFYELFAEDGPSADAERWQQIAEVSRQYFVDSAHPTTGLHPDYANFDGTPNTGGSQHDEFRYDAWRVLLNMGIDYDWYSQDPRLKTQVDKYYSFFSTRLTANNVANSLFQLDGSNASGGGSTALTATLAAGALATDSALRKQFVQNLWNVQQQSGQYRYYQQLVYLLGLLSVSGQFAYDWE